MSGSQPQFRLSPKKSFSVRKTQPPVRAAGHKSFIRNILPASLAFPRIYPYPFRSDDPNSNEVRILAERYKKNYEIYTCETGCGRSYGFPSRSSTTSAMSCSWTTARVFPSGDQWKSVIDSEVK